MSGASDVEDRAASLRSGAEEQASRPQTAERSVNRSGVVAPNTSSPAWHTTRSVLDGADRVTEVWDARGLSQATWRFTYDYAGSRLKAEHTTYPTCRLPAQ